MQFGDTATEDIPKLRDNIKKVLGDKKGYESRRDFEDMTK